MQHTLTDQSLLADAHQGSARAFEDLIGPLVEPGYRLACGMLHDSDAAKDAVQEATLKAWRKLRQVQVGEKLRPWFLGIVANECRNARRLKWWASVSVGLPEVAQGSPEEEIVRGTDLRRALGQLKHEDRAVVVLFFYVDLPLEEVAAILGISPAAARARLYRSVHRLRPDIEIEEALK